MEAEESPVIAKVEILGVMTSARTAIAGAKTVVPSGASARVLEAVKGVSVGSILTIYAGFSSCGGGFGETAGKNGFIAGKFAGEYILLAKWHFDPSLWEARRDKEPRR